MNRAISFVRAQPVLIAAFIAAAVTMIFIMPDEKYIGYCNFSVIAELFALMTAVAGLREAGIFDIFTSSLLKHAGNERRLSQLFILMCFFSSMLVTNDVALITFVPLTLAAYEGIKDERGRILTVVLETAAANLGSMMTPVGNPQNLYIYDKFGLTPIQFILAMLPAGCISIVILILLSLLIPKKDCEAEKKPPQKLSYTLAAVYTALFIICVITVFKLLPFYICAIAAVAAALFTDRKLLLKADYALLVTFLCFFIFVGNISRIGSISSFFSEMIAGRVIPVAALLSQVISNVPAAVMLSGFTADGTALLIGVNLGGLGTPIASMASLISLQLYRSSENAHTGKYLAFFSAVNFGMLAVLLAVQLLLFR
ncbi:MAG: citrate transporter [Ruminiclostridium sp.]|nr:citrate transporter [Ruminiclostridium sp.]